ncbi:MAG: hypothetical protein FJ095_17965 [Deltaproteobacteria bacterium]|nr:hypothetical protein [Deltaproteobacteria bacterium]
MDDWSRAEQAVAALKEDTAGDVVIRKCVGTSELGVRLGYREKPLTEAECRTSHGKEAASAWTKVGLTAEAAATECFAVEGATYCQFNMGCDTDPRPSLASNGFAERSTVIARGASGMMAMGGMEGFLALRPLALSPSYPSKLASLAEGVVNEFESVCKAPFAGASETSKCFEFVERVRSSSPDSLLPAGQAVAKHDGVVLLSAGCAAVAQRTLSKVHGSVVERLGLDGARLTTLADAALAAARLERCAAPETSHDCDEAGRVRRLFEKHARLFQDAPRRVSRIAQTEDGARARLDALADDEDWADVPVVRCMAPTSEDACAPVDGYLRRRPEGSHRAEAEKALQKATPKLAQLRTAREQEERVEAQRQAAEEARAEARRRSEEARARAEEQKWMARRAREEAAERASARRSSSSGSRCTGELTYAHAAGNFMFNCDTSEGRSCVLGRLGGGGNFTEWEIGSVMSACCCRVMN